MRLLKNTSIIIVLTLIFSAAGSYAQSKLDKRTKEALEQRYQDDKYYADFQRGIYNRENWKNSWVGARLSDIYKKWGAPAKAFPDADGGQVVVYEKMSNYGGGSYTPGYTITGYNVFGQAVNSETVQSKDTRWASQYVETTTVFVDKNGVVTKVDYKINSSRSGNYF
ncbi:hypothetical protein QFZ48_001467 [Chitinophaga sp. W2I13]|uniref:hypothetical protein n=1 Tax=Chitinophaga sp. W2I13 TaxID=3373923 RepID=UPI003D237B56